MTKDRTTLSTKPVSVSPRMVLDDDTRARQREAMGKLPSDRELLRRRFADVRQEIVAERSRIQVSDGSAAVPPDDFGEHLTQGFADAVKAAIQGAHTQGLAVSAYEDGIAIEVLPDGTKVPIDETVEWSPFAWRTRNLG